MASEETTVTTEYITADILTRNAKADSTDYTVTGDGLFDDLMETATKHLQMQFEANRIRQEDYAVAYVDIYKATLTAAIQAWTTTISDKKNAEELELLKAQAELARAQAEVYKYQANSVLPAQVLKYNAETALTEQQTVSEIAKEKLYYRQIEGFDENYKEKMLKIMLDSWSVGFSVSASTFSEIPNPMTKAVIDKVWDDYMKDDFDFSTIESNNAGPRDNTTASTKVTPTETNISNGEVTYS